MILTLSLSALFFPFNTSLLHLFIYLLNFPLCFYSPSLPFDFLSNVSLLFTFSVSLRFFFPFCFHSLLISFPICFLFLSLPYFLSSVFFFSLCFLFLTNISFSFCFHLSLFPILALCFRFLYMLHYSSYTFSFPLSFSRFFSSCSAFSKYISPSLTFFLALFCLRFLLSQLSFLGLYILLCSSLLCLSHLIIYFPLCFLNLLHLLSSPPPPHSYCLVSFSPM